MSYHNATSEEEFIICFNNQCNSNEIDEDGNTILHKYIMKNYEEKRLMINCILDYLMDFDLNIKNRDGNTALHLIQENESDIAKRLLDSYANPFIINNENKTFFDSYYSWSYLHSNYLKESMLEVIKDINTSDRSGNNILHKYCGKFSYVPILKMLLDNGHDVNQRNFYGDTPLHLYVQDIQTFKHMLSLFKNINVTNNKGETILHCLMKRDIPFKEKKELKKLLYEKGIDSEIIDKNGKLARQYLNIRERFRMKLF